MNSMLCEQSLLIVPIKGQCFSEARNQAFATVLCYMNQCSLADLGSRCLCSSQRGVFLEAAPGVASTGN